MTISSTLLTVHQFEFKSFHISFKAVLPALPNCDACRWNIEQHLLLLSCHVATPFVRISSRSFRLHVWCWPCLDL